MHIYRYNSKQVEWQLVPVGNAAEIGQGGRGEIALGADVDQPRALLHCCADSNGKARCLLITYPGTVVNINGRRAFPVQVLLDRDEISLEGDKVYFTDESPAKVVRFRNQEGQPPMFCARCKLVIDGDAVRCPGSCGLWYHESDERNCWSYDSQCLVCRHSSGPGLSWRPTPRAPRAAMRRD